MIFETIFALFKVFVALIVYVIAFFSWKHSKLMKRLKFYEG